MLSNSVGGLDSITVELYSYATTSRSRCSASWSCRT